MEPCFTWQLQELDLWTGKGRHPRVGYWPHEQMKDLCSHRRRRIPIHMQGWLKPVVGTLPSSNRAGPHADHEKVRRWKNTGYPDVKLKRVKPGWSYRTILPADGPEFCLQTDLLKCVVRPIETVKSNLTYIYHSLLSKSLYASENEINRELCLLQSYHCQWVLCLKFSLSQNVRRQ